MVIRRVLSYRTRGKLWEVSLEQLGLEQSRGQEQQVWGVECGGAGTGSTERPEGVAMGGGHRGGLLGGGFLNICHRKDCGSPKPLDAWDSSQWPLCPSHGTWHRPVPRTLAP